MTTVGEHGAILLLVALLGCTAFDQTTTSTTWFPKDMLYPHPFADPRCPSLGSRYQVSLKGDINDKIENTFGAEGSFYRVTRKAQGDAFEIGYDTGAFSRFDAHESLDMDAVDFTIGFPLAWRSGPLAVKLHPWHLTSHLGDEYEERENATRIDYARNTVGLGVAYDIAEVWRVYGEADYAFRVGSLNKRGRWMAGVEWVDEIFGQGNPAAYAGLNMTSFQETDWSINYNFQTGLWFRPQASDLTLRLGLEYYHGYSALTQFFREREEFLSFGLWIHL
jgi:hypothetical protein